MTRTHCPICRTPFDVTEALIGQKGLCSNCGAKFLITPPDPATSRETGRTTQPITMKPDLVSTEKSRSSRSATTGILFATLIGLVAAALVYWLRTAPLPEFLSKWVQFIGEMHPLFIHYPVAWIAGIFVLGIFGGAKHSPALRILLWLNLLTCAAGIVAGQCWALDHNEGVTLTRHFYAGLAVGGFSWLALVLFLRSPEVHTKLYRLAVFGAMGSVAVAGHLGATLTHGEILDHLPWKEKPPTQKTETLSSSLPLSERTVLDVVILPIMQARCVACHGADKQKGELRLDSHAAMLAKGESDKPSMVVGDPNNSASLLRIKLPLEDEDHMPPAKKPQVEPAELAVLTWWVQAGADPKLKLGEAPAPDDIKKQLEALAANPPKTAPLTGG
jgi:hypothetical protein